MDRDGDPEMSGRERDSSISERTKIPLGWAVTIVVTLIGGVSSVTAAQARLSQLERDNQELRHSLDAEHRAIEDLRGSFQTFSVDTQLRVQRSEDNTARLLQWMGRVESKLDQLSTRAPR